MFIRTLEILLYQKRFDITFKSATLKMCVFETSLFGRYGFGMLVTIFYTMGILRQKCSYSEFF